MTIVGKLYDRQTSQITNAEVRLNSSNLVELHASGEVRYIDASQIQISSRLGNSARFIDIDQVGRFETRDNTSVDQLAQSLGQTKSASLLHKLEANLGLIFIAILVTIAFVWGSFTYGVPYVTDRVVDALPERAEDILEARMLEELEERWFKPSQLSAERQAEIQALFTQVAASNSLDVSDKNYRLKIRDASHSVGANALAFPAGTVVLTDQLVELLESDKQLAGILAHELGHLKARHGMRQIVRGSLLSFVVAMISGDVSGASTLLITAPVVLLELQYSREFELEADQYAIDYLDCDVEGLKAMGDFFYRLGNLANEPENGESSKQANNSEERQSINQTGGFAEYLSSHPANDKRRERFQSVISEECGATQNL
ncbi:MAG: M48 family metallopeptidase [Pseudomonadota bacterium]